MDSFLAHLKHWALNAVLLCAAPHLLREGRFNIFYCILHFLKSSQLLGRIFAYAWEIDGCLTGSPELTGKGHIVSSSNVRIRGETGFSDVLVFISAVSARLYSEFFLIATNADVERTCFES